MLEKETREFIDAKLKKQGRNIDNHRQVAIEFPIEKNWTTLFADYALLDTDGKVIAIIEAKKFSRSARDGEHQAQEYAELLEAKQWYRPFVFLSNAKEIYFYNSVKNQAPRKVKTFFTLQDLHRLKFLNETQTSANDEKINPDIAGRHYQIAAIKSVTEWIAVGKRKFLLVMATGTGKTRTAMALIDIMLKTHNAQKILFLTDRTALRDQAFDDWFKVYFPEEPKTKIESGNTNNNARLYSANYQTMINYLDYYSSGYFDMIIVDEVHRSIYGEWKAILEHFDCYQVWLTATPVDFIERSTYKEFDCHEKWPTYNYGLDEAVQEWYLVPYRVLMARTQFQIQWIKGRQLPNHLREQLIKEWKNPEDYNFEGSEIWKKIDNKDTNRAIVREFMQQSYKIEDWLPGKSIIFAMNQAHAEHIQETFEELYPYLNKFSVVITSNVERADQLLKAFKKQKTEKKYRVAISVDMLDTGVDVPELVNLVFAKKVFSEAKFRQMVGRWTRLCPNIYWPGEDKKDFLIIDFALNFDDGHKFKAPDKQAISLQQKYFELKIDQLKLFENREDKKNLEKTKKEILTIIKSLKPNDELLANKELIDKIISESIWNNIAVNPYEQLQKIAPLTRYYDKNTADEIRFLIKNEQLAIAILKDEDKEDLINKIASDINALSKNISKVQEKESTIQEILNPKYRDTISLEKIHDIKKEFTPLMKYRDINRPDILITDLKDEVIIRTWIEYADGKKMESDKYRALFVHQLEDYAKSSTAIQKILQDQALESQDIQELEAMLSKTEYNLNVINLRKVFHTPTVSFEKLIKVALGKWSLPWRESQVHQLFESYIHQHNFSSAQIKFLQIVKSLIIQKKHITYDDFYSPVFESVFGMWAFDRLFKQEEAKQLMEFVEVFSL